MDIKLNNIGKRYRFEWIFKAVTKTFSNNGNYAILGPNGSGKSTLMRILAGFLSPNKGAIVFSLGNQTIDNEAIYKHINYAAPYIDLIEEFTLEECLTFHQHFKPFIGDLTNSDLIDLLQFSKARHKAIKYFSSGMKQRLKLVLSICSVSDLLLLDEPTSNLDKQGVDWYHHLIENYTDNRTVIVASNVEQDYLFCSEQLLISDYK